MNGQPDAGEGGAGKIAPNRLVKRFYEAMKESGKQGGNKNQWCSQHPGEVYVDAKKFLEMQQANTQHKHCKSSPHKRPCRALKSTQLVVGEDAGEAGHGVIIVTVLWIWKSRVIPKSGSLIGSLVFTIRSTTVKNFGTARYNSASLI
ncbi:MAG: hypothetical protein H6R19_2913 [Proteobacteria bacterium]|nr:hypothetical protein [Pseudomonadota bacterium]